MFDNLVEHRSNLHVYIGAYWNQPEAILKQLVDLTVQDIQPFFNATMSVDEATVTKKTHVRYVMDIFFDAVPAPVEEPIAEEKVDDETGA